MYNLKYLSNLCVGTITSPWHSSHLHMWSELDGFVWKGTNCWNWVKGITQRSSPSTFLTNISIYLLCSSFQPGHGRIAKLPVVVWVRRFSRGFGQKNVLGLGLSTKKHI